MASGFLFNFQQFANSSGLNLTRFQAICVLSIRNSFYSLCLSLFLYYLQNFAEVWIDIRDSFVLSVCQSSDFVMLSPIAIWDW